MEWYKKAADKGDADAMCCIGYLYDQGLGVAQDYTQAMEWYKKAADKGDATAIYCIAWFYYDGCCVRKNLDKAFQLFKKAAEAPENPDCDAMKLLSECYRFGYGTTQDITKADYWLKKAQDAGSEDANKIKRLMMR